MRGPRAWLDALGWRREGPRAAAAAPTTGGTRAQAPQPRLAGRLSSDWPALVTSYPLILPPPSAERQWRLGDLDATTLDKVDPFKLIQYLCDLSPEISNAVFNLLRLFNPGWEAVAYRPGSDAVDAPAQALVDAFFDLLSAPRMYGSADVPLGRLFLGNYLRGAFFAELVLGADGRAPVDLATPDPATVRFRRTADEVRGAIWTPGQQIGGKFVAFDRPTISYVPFDPFPGSPYGRPLASPALFPGLFLLGLLHDTRRVLAQQGQYRWHFSIDTEKLQAAMPEPDRENPEAFKDWADAAIADFQSFYRSLKPDDAIVALDAIKANPPVGTVNVQTMGGISQMIEALERMCAKGLKVMPFTQGLSQSTTETQANRQFEMQAQAVRSVQHPCETLLSRFLDLGCQAQGIQAHCELRFAENRSSERLRDAQADALEIANAERRYWAGWISQDEAARQGAGKDKADQEAPRATPQGETPTSPANPATVQPEPGLNRGVPVGGPLLVAAEPDGLANGHMLTNGSAT
jgi:hypothetical protein